MASRLALPATMSTWGYVWSVKPSLDCAALVAHIDQALSAERKEMNMNPPYATSPGHIWDLVDNDG